MTQDEKIAKLRDFKLKVQQYGREYDPELRSSINQDTVWVRREIIEAGCFHTVTVGPPPAVGGLIMRDLDPFGMMFNPPYGMSLIPTVVDMIDKAIGVLQIPPADTQSRQRQVQIDFDIQKGYAFIAMPISEHDHELVDVLDAIKEAAKRCGIHAERIDEPQSNERITDRILESIRRAEYVIVDLTKSRPNVFYEAGYAYGIGKTPIYVARSGTSLEFDLKDYPIIFFRNMKELKDGLERRLRGLAEEHQA
jgi:hypothetical protein